MSELRRQGLSVQAVSELTGFDRKTVRKYLLKSDSISRYGPRPKAASKLDPFKPYLDEPLARRECGTRRFCCGNCTSVNTARQLHDPDRLVPAAEGRWLQ